MTRKANKDRLYKDVEFLTEIRPFRNYLNMESLNEASTYIKEVMTEAKLDVQEQKWMAEGREYTNVIASYNSDKKKRLVVGAHYDVCGDQPGADDNASAVAGLLETARMIGAGKPDLDYRIDLVAYCLEEPPFFYTNEMGSYIHARSLYDEGADVIGMICYEMIGYFSDEPGSQPYPDPALANIYPNTGDFIIVVGIEDYTDFNARIQKLMAENSNIDVQKIDFPDRTGLAGMSDHINYWRFGYPAAMINDTSFLRNPNYHLPSDTIDTLDFEKMTEVITGCYHAIIGLESQ